MYRSQVIKFPVRKGIHEWHEARFCCYCLWKLLYHFCVLYTIVIVIIGALKRLMSPNIIMKRSSAAKSNNTTNQSINYKNRSKKIIANKQFCYYMSRGILSCDLGYLNQRTHSACHFLETNVTTQVLVNQRLGAKWDQNKKIV